MATRTATEWPTRREVRALVALRAVPFRELRRNNGDRGSRCWVAVGGRVYDVTDCPKWRTGLHEGLHFPGQVLDDELPDAPHEREVFDRPCVQQIGWLVEGD